MQTNRGYEPAFPTQGEAGYFPGMTIREYYAGLIAAAMSSAGKFFDFSNGYPEDLAKCAVQQADALIAALSSDKK